jgi:hypothetical protein
MKPHSLSMHAVYLTVSWKTALWKKGCYYLNIIIHRQKSGLSFDCFITTSLECDGTCAETRFRLSTKGTSPFKSAGASVQSTIGRRAVNISLQGLYCSCKPVFCRHVTLTGYPLHSLVSLSLLLPCVMCHYISTGL